MKTEKILIVAVLAVAIGSVAFLFSAQSTDAGEGTNLAQCLAENGAVMYGTNWCKYCTQQKGLFGTSFKNVDYVNCDTDREACELAGVRGYPTWVINGQNYEGVQPLEKLASLTGCSL